LFFHSNKDNYFFYLCIIKIVVMIKGKTGIQKAVDIKRMMKQTEEIREAIIQAQVYKKIKKNGSK